jgi:hypothetical protein
VPEGISLSIRGGCGIDIPLERAEENGRFYTTKTCNNPALMLKSSQATVRKTCASCPHADLQPQRTEVPQMPEPIVAATTPAQTPAPQIPAPQTHAMPMQAPVQMPVQSAQLPSDAQPTTEVAAVSPPAPPIELPADVPPPLTEPEQTPEVIAHAEAVATARAARERADAEKAAAPPLPMPPPTPPMPPAPALPAPLPHQPSGVLYDVQVAQEERDAATPPTPPAPPTPPMMPLQVVGVQPPAPAVPQPPAGLPTSVMPPGAAASVQLPSQSPMPQQQESFTVPTQPADPQLIQFGVQPPTSDFGPVVTPTTFIPGINLAGLDDQSTVDIDAVLSSIPGLEGGPSTGGFSWSPLGVEASCERKSFYATAMGLQKKGKVTALQVGTLVHACMELHYKSGGMRTFEPCDAVANAGAVDIAADARRYVYAHIQMFGQEEAQTWDVRGVELQGTWFMPPEKIGGKTVHIPLTCRHDLVVALRSPGAPCTPPGQPAMGGVHVVDYKTASRLSYDLTKGYGMDGQFLMNALVYRQAEAQTFGPLAGIIVSIIAKHKKMTADSLFRVHTTADEASVAEFYHAEVRPLAVRLYSKLADPVKRTDRTKWPKNHASCVTRYGLCPYFDICDLPPGSEDAVMADMYYVDETRVKKIEELRQPDAETKRVSGKTESEVSSAEQERQAKKEFRRDAKKLAMDTLLATLSGFEALQASAFIEEGKDRKTVKAELSAALATSWAVGSKFNLSDTVGMTITTKGVSWSESASGVRSSFAWNVVAGAMVEDWYNPSKHEPTSGGDEE